MLIIFSLNKVNQLECIWQFFEGQGTKERWEIDWAWRSCQLGVWKPTGPSAAIFRGLFFVPVSSRLTSPFQNFKKIDVLQRSQAFFNKILKRKKNGLICKSQSTLNVRKLAAVRALSFSFSMRWQILYLMVPWSWSSNFARSHSNTGHLIVLTWG